MAETMKAAVVHEYGKPLVIEEVPVPEVRPGRILVKVEACGVCHTDLHAAEGDPRLAIRFLRRHPRGDVLPHLERDVRRELNVLPGSVPAPVIIRCEDKI